MNYRVYARFIHAGQRWAPISWGHGEVRVERLLIHATHWETYEQAAAVASKLTNAVRAYEFEVRKA